MKYTYNKLVCITSASLLLSTGTLNAQELQLQSAANADKPDTSVVAGPTTGSVETLTDSKGERRSLGAWFGDTATAASVQTRLLADTNTSDIDITIVVNGDVVILSGIVQTEKERDMAEKIAKQARGITAVVNLLELVETN